MSTVKDIAYRIDKSETTLIVAHHSCVCDVDDAIHHQHVAYRQTCIAGAEHIAVATTQ